MEDITISLLEIARADFIHNMENDQVIVEMLKKIKVGATYEYCGNYAERIGNALVQAIRDNITADMLPDGKMYWNIANRVIRPLLEIDYNTISDAAIQVQQLINDSAQIGIKAQRAELNTERIDGILNKLTSDNYENVRWILADPIVTFSRSVVDDTLKANFDFQGKAGLSPKIVRTAERKCCKWCSSLAGTYSYPGTPDEVFKRHDYCRCVVEYIASKDKSKLVHSGMEGKRKYVKNSKGNYEITKEARVTELSKRRERDRKRREEEKRKRMNALTT